MKWVILLRFLLYVDKTGRQIQMNRRETPNEYQYFISAIKEKI
jgi:hypothetical protein